MWIPSMGLVRFADFPGTCFRLEAALELVEDGDALKRVRIICLPTLVWLDSCELEGDEDIVFFTVPGMFLFPDVN